MARAFVPGVSFVRGVNLPWLSYGNDFGGNAWHPAGGVARAGRRRQLDAICARLAASGTHVVRWFILCDGRSGICEDTDGMPAGLDEFALDDFKIALAAVENYGLSLMPVVLDFHWCHQLRDDDGVRCGGRSADLADAGRRARLLEQVLRPMLSRFGSSKWIAAWDLINEPEWVTFSWCTWNPHLAVLPDVMCDYISEAAALVHDCTEHPATVGLASAASLARMRGLGLDLYQTHWYDRLEARTPLATSVASFETDGPVILGEFPTRGSSRRPHEIEETARLAGYHGALAWSVCAADEASDEESVWTWLTADA